MSSEKSPFAMIFRPFLLIFLVLAGCQPPPPDNSPFDPGRPLGINSNEKLEETSGITASARYPGYLWAHNDSGHPADLFLLDTLGKTKTKFRLNGIKNRDWEDIAFGPGRDSTNYLYVGDIGDNNERHAVKIIYCVEEPALDQPGDLSVADTLMIRMEDRPRDTEAMVVDPVSRNLYLITKRERNVWLYEVSFPFLGDTLTAFRLIELPLQHIVAGDISRDGREILLKSYNRIFYWKRSPQQSIPEALKLPFVELVYTPEPQGESIAWATDGSGFYTLGENAKGVRAKLYFYKRRLSVDSAQGNRSPKK